MMTIPKQISPCPIIEAIIEIQFQSSIPDEAIFGVVYNEFRNEYEKLEKLPILQLPEAIRSQDKNLANKPHYKLTKENYILQVGPKAFSLINVNEYSGWTEFSKKISETFRKFLKLNIIKEINRLGLRYVNLFNNLNVFEKSTLEILHNSNQLAGNELNIVTVFNDPKFSKRLTIANNALVVALQNKRHRGSIIDIDIVARQKVNSDNIEATIEQAHIEEKKLFFSLLNPDYISSLNPIY